MCPLNELVKKGAPESFELDEEHKEGFQTLVDVVTSLPLLALPVKGLSYFVNTDVRAY